MTMTTAMTEFDPDAGPGEIKIKHQSVAAVVYSEGAYPDKIMKHVVDRCRMRGTRLAGVVQYRSRYPSHSCDMVLENLATGRQTSIFADRGRGAKGCQLDEYAMLQTVSEIELALKDGPGLLVLNKFGKVEAEGMGMRDLIAQAMCMGIPVIVGVPARNLHAWREFAREFSIELHSSADVESWLEPAGDHAPSAQGVGTLVMRRDDLEAS
jgi:nucleoside-triphosphatase THEP1